MEKDYEVSFPFRSGSAFMTLKEDAVDEVDVREVERFPQVWPDVVS
jgi:hypothetical protein